MRHPLSNSRLSATLFPVVALATLMLLPPRVRAVANELSCSPTHLRFANVVVGQTETLLALATNNGPSRVTILSVGVSDSNFKVSNLMLPRVLAPGESLAVSVTFTPTARVAFGGVITLLSNASNRVLYLGLAGTGVTSEAVTVNPRNVSFGDVELGTSLKLPVLLTNTSRSKVTLDGLQTEGRGFWVSGGTFPLTLRPGQELMLDITFKPQVVGPAGGSSFIPGPAVNIPFTGIGVNKPQLGIIPAVLNFGDVAVGTTETRMLELSADGGSVTVSSVSSSSSQFAVPDARFPLTVAAGKSVSLTVAFTPKSSGNPSATLTFSSNAADSPTYSGLTGTATLPIVSLSWIASTSPEVTGYNIYRKTSSDPSYARINSRLDPDTNFTDTNVIPGETYYYATTAVNTKGKESDYSNHVEVVVP
jgi:Abnormal spindle-like microcephaly-assoc'd, ASPM-SPD-2-Hydin